ncbi:MULTISPECIES: ribonucleoside hydrolase RihC [Leuconostoc]|uniref:Purine nucleosidase n=2 Tax=Leuconostoc kimchii TaxID=136609 RepID=D5T1Q8_LEUKI|nr:MULTISPECIES: ribonucleoside hydrolase RihC [Leuconostoc]ADG40207.1 purine nucleosidase [Leuconostoc kimchii IMSNU 11154]AEJ31852.1 ribonucleoside hydrolase RihC [Leuconostoc sp. C2]QBR46719.1 ribonucleoside hydrolase RihC [Leuconostoc kimchii]
MTPIILDMDPGIDDAVALSIALTHSAIDIKLLTSVAGNVSVDKTTTNLLKLTTFFKQTQIPVARGAAAPLKKAFVDASYIHGASGMPGYEFPEITTKPLTTDAIEAMAKVLSDAPEPMTIVATGSYTNIALLIQKHPELLSKIKSFVLMGGSLSGGNVSSVAEFNVFTDPDAASIVFKSGVPLVMIGLDVTLKALLSLETIDAVADLGEAGNMLHKLMTAYGDSEPGGKPMHDVNTICYLIHPEFYTTKEYWVDIITDGPATGATIADTQNRWSQGKVNAKVAINIDTQAFEKWFMAQIPNMNQYCEGAV